MRLQPIVERLKARGFRRVYGALELAGLARQPAQLPAFFVVPDSWTADPNRMVGVHDQRRVQRFGIVIMLNAAGLREDRISDEIEEQERAVIDAIAGWTMPGASRACEVVGGRTLSVNGNAFCWMTSFSTADHIRKAPS